MPEAKQKTPTVKIVIIVVALIAILVGFLSYQRSQKMEKYMRLNQEEDRVYQIIMDIESDLETATGDRKTELEASLKEAKILFSEIEASAEKFRPN